LMQPKKYFWLILLFTLLVACQNKPGAPRQVANWQPEAANDYSFLDTPTPIPTPTDLPIPTLEPTPTAVSEIEIPTRVATAVPAGIYTRDFDGLNFIYPSQWILDSEFGNVVALRDPSLDLIVTVNYDYAEADFSYERLRDNILGEYGDSLSLSDVQTISEIEINFAGSNTAQRAILNATESDGEPIGIYLAYALTEDHFFTLVAFGRPDNINARLHTLDAMVNQVSLGAKTLYGLNHDETLVLLGSDPFLPSLDPATVTGSAAGYVGLLYSGLVRLTPELQIVPELAERWDVSEDGTVYTFTLREGLTFADGRPLTTEDVQYSWERAADPETESRTAATYLNDIAGMADKLAGRADEISGLEVVDERTLVVTLDGPKPYFLAKLTYPTSYVVDRETVESRPLDDWALSPNSSGPYTIAEYRDFEVLIFASNEAYHTPPAVGNVVYLLSNQADPLNMFKSGNLDLLFLGNTDAEQIRRPSDPLNAQLVSGTSLCTTLIQMNNTLSPFDDVNVRRAFALAVDKSALNTILANDLSVRADTILPPAMPGYSLDLAEEQAAKHNNAALAQEALAASGYADGLPPIIIAATGLGNAERDDLNAMIQNWREILGAEVSVEFVSPTNSTGNLRLNNSHMVSYGWCADYPDPQNFLDILYHSESNFNVAGFNDPVIDDLLEQARVELDVSARLLLYQSIEEQLLRDAAAIPLLHGVSDALVSDRVEGYVMAPIGAPFVPYVTINPEAGEGE
jgi:oligopeptide transport system substrate-binding protein